MEENSIIVRYSEIFLKSERVFRIYESKLIKNIFDHLKRENVKVEVKRAERGRIFIFTNEVKSCLNVLKNIFGIHSFSPAIYLKTREKEELAKFIRENYERLIPKNKTFAIRVNRSFDTEYTSKELESYLGSFVERKVDLEKPDIQINFDIRKIGTFVYTQIYQGPKGLPISSSGRVISLLSGGIDSPVASYFAMKRGCEVVYLHFSGFPITSKKSIEKVEKIVKVLNKYQIRSKLYVAKIGEYQLKMKNLIDPKYLIIMYRRLMFRVAEKIAKSENAEALVTGESLAQVSSQTLHNLKVIESVVKIPVLRPLIGFDKEEIIEISKRIGTYDISIMPCEDTCSLFAPKHSSAFVNEEKVKEFEKLIDINKIVKKIVKETEVKLI
ncbi:MAG: tRNA uracil 4-sulfurtransferase ThiI [Candidatus Aenigmarchaeota archaeon]|nr:tRNA 4-thiouridine(8) synthase ThiI [Candidatus Aenigmarchaeota archaeon]MDW8160029.1 tRNA uracil 4-sulfurtransferase ThiI [Candidatus Aenigmarchaeota archaeon]